MSDDPVQFVFTCYAAPVQAEGTIAGRPFYFRARNDEWSFSISDDPAVDPVDIQTVESGKAHGFFREEPYGSLRTFDASYMPREEAEAIIRRCAGEYLARRPAA